MYPVVTQSTSELQWVKINCIPEYDDQGRLLGAFGVWRNINDLMSKQDQLRKETKRAQESGKMKSVFLAKTRNFSIRPSERMSSAYSRMRPPNSDQ